MTKTRPDEPPLPPFMQHLPRDHRGFVVPWFVPRINGKWNFQVIRPERVAQAVRSRWCWICGRPLRRGGILAFAVGPMCLVNKVSAEPPSHKACAEAAVKMCPFLLRPKMRRAPMDEDKDPAPGIMIDRNPGVTVLWVTRRYAPFRPSLGGAGLLMKILEPTVSIECWAEGRKATEEEIEHSFVTGLPNLEKVAREDDAFNGDHSATEELARRVAEAWKLLGLKGAPGTAPGRPQEAAQAAAAG